MSDLNNGNTQVQPDANPPTSTGPTVEELAAKVAELEKAREGLIRDNQEERRKRHELEQRASPVPAPSPEYKQDVTTDELGKVLDPYNKPIRDKAEAAYKAAMDLQAKLELDSALSYLSEKAGKKVSLNDPIVDKVKETIRKWNLNGSDSELAVKAWDLMELEGLKVKEDERTRKNSVSDNASLPTGAPPKVGTAKEFTKEEFNRMTVAEYDTLESKGGFRKVGDKFVYTPNS
jgi:hypothetical protein